MDPSDEAAKFRFRLLLVSAWAAAAGTVRSCAVATARPQSRPKTDGASQLMWIVRCVRFLVVERSSSNNSRCHCGYCLLQVDKVHVSISVCCTLFVLTILFRCVCRCVSVCLWAPTLPFPWKPTIHYYYYTRLLRLLLRAAATLLHIHTHTHTQYTPPHPKPPESLFLVIAAAALV